MSNLDCVVITGAGQGIGRAIALEAGRRKLHVLCLSKSANCEETRAEIEHAGGSAESLRLDIGELDETRASMSGWVAKTNFKRLGLVLAAGVLGPQDFTDLTGWEESYRINLLGNLAVYAGLSSRMIENRFGRILCFGGGGAAYAYPMFPAYAASKAAMVRTVENLQETLNDKGDFAAVCVAPGANDTAMLKAVRAAGAVVKTTVDISEPAGFALEFLLCENCGFKGGFVHVRDNWRELLNGGGMIGKDKWKLRRIES